jgi:transposase
LKQTSICVARHAKAVLKMQINKSDRNDAAGSARIMQTGWFKEVRVKDLDSHSVRALLASRALLVKIKRDLENQIRGLLKNVGLVIGRVPSSMSLRQVRRFMTVPGIGPITALCFKATIDDPTRFKRSRSVGAYVGLTTRRHASGEIDWMGRISKCGDAMLRSYLFEAAGVLLTRVPKWSALKAWGMRLAKRSGFRKATVAVARKLAVILHRMWVDGTEFNWSKKEVLIAALNSIEPFLINVALIDLFYANEEWAKLRRPGAVDFAKRRLAGLSKSLGDKPYLDGDRFTAGDLMMTTVLRILKHTDIVTGDERLAAYIDRCTARPAFKRGDDVAPALRAHELHL